MNRVFFSIVIVFVVVAGLLAYQATQTGTSLVLLPSELLAEVRSGNDHLKKIRVAGRVTSDEIKYQVEPSIELKFMIEDPENPEGKVPVTYQGLKPDMFATGRDVIIDGAFNDGVLHAANLLTQCPSKYEAPDPQDYHKAS